MTEEAEVKKSGNGLVIMLLVLVVLLLVGVGVLVAFLMTSGSSGGAATQGATQEAVIEAPLGYKAFKEPEEGTPPQYFEMNFVVNFRGEGMAKYLAVDMKFMSRYPEVITELETLSPMLESEITMLLRRQTYSALNEDDGDANLRKSLLQIARDIADENRIDPSLIANVYLTRLVTQ